MPITSLDMLFLWLFIYLAKAYSILPFLSILDIILVFYSLNKINLHMLLWLIIIYLVGYPSKWPIKIRVKSGFTVDLQSYNIVNEYLKSIFAPSTFYGVIGWLKSNHVTHLL